MNNTPQDETIEALLRRQFDGPVADDGFSEKVMAQLPPRRRHRAWPLRAGALAGIVACGSSLAGAPWLRAGWHDWLDHHLSAPALGLGLVAAGMAWLALAWTLAEGGQH